MSLDISSLFELYDSPYGWPYRQLKIPEAHSVTRGSPEIIIAVIDLGYREHRDHTDHLWRNPNPTHGDIHGWDCHDDDASLEFVGRNADSPYNVNHHAFVVGEAIACAPESPVMVVRVGYDHPDSWWRGIDYALEHGARVIVLPHGFISHGTDSPIPLFYAGTDFGYPIDNPELRRCFDDVWDAGCIICKGTADNRGRRVASPIVGHDAVFPVGSSNKMGRAADICPSSDYVLAATPGGERSSSDETDLIWSTGGSNDYVSFSGGCMASAFAGGVAALVRSRFPDLGIGEVKMVLKNTADGDSWNPRTGWGILDAHRAVSLEPTVLRQIGRIREDSAALSGERSSLKLNVTLTNDGAFDIERALVVAFDGDPLTAADPSASRENPKTLLRKQIGHTITSLRGLHATECEIEIEGEKPSEVYLQVCSLDHHGSYEADTKQLRI